MTQVRILDDYIKQIALVFIGRIELAGLKLTEPTGMVNLNQVASLTIQLN